MSQYTPLDNDGDCVEFDVDRIEQMVVEFEPCRECDGEGIVLINGIHFRICPFCHGTGMTEKEG